MTAPESKVAAPVGGVTPGPWKVLENDYYDNGWTIDSADGYRVAMLPNVSKLPENAANARLIAVSPDLYVFAQEIAIGAYTLDEASKRARELLCKATGASA